MLTEICQEIRNWFCYKKLYGTYKIEEGVVSPFLSDLIPGQYYRIIGSIFNDGVHKVGEADLVDETFEGSIWLMAVPSEIVLLDKSITEYVDKYGEVSPYTSESFNGYSYTKRSNSNGTPITWREAYAKTLNKWRKV